jgi:predicted RecB family nuclease
MLITDVTFEAFLKCETKSHLYFQRAVGVQSEFSEWQRNLRQKFKETGWERLRSTVREDQWCVGTPALQSLEDRRYHFIIDYTVALPEVHSRLHALELIRSASKTRDHLYIPLRFVPSEKLSIDDRLLLAFDAFALSQTCGKTPHVGRIIHASQYATVTVPLAGLLDKVRLVLGNMAAQQVSTTAPPLVLNKHCAECEFRSRCRQTAIEKDDLSLLPNIGEKERKKQNDKGIFTVLQLSYTFRPRRRPARGLLKHQPALKALALRKNQIHILGTPAVSQSGTPVYLDVEGDPDRDFYYLIGLRIGSGGSAVHYSFWANDFADERTVWEGCLRVLSMIDNPRLIHYGSYETHFLKRMRTRYPDIESPSFLGHLISSALNLLSVIYAHVYFPTYSNGLKEVASYLGFRWTDGTASGLTALVWRSQWESSHDPSLKEKLLAYNAEDCAAAEKVTEAICAICRSSSPEDAPNLTAVNVDSLKREYPQRFGEVKFALPEFQQINDAAYWDYQRNKVYIRSNQRLKRISRKTAMERTLAKVPVNKVITVEEQRPASCRCCNSTLIYRFGRMSQIVYDLIFSTSGVKRWVTRYSFSRYICWHCKATLQLYIHKQKYGIGLRSYLLYEIIELQIPQNAISKIVRQLFSLPLSRGAVNRVKATEADRYEGTYRAILDRVAAGNLVHADETKVAINGKEGYVWVFTNLEDVAFVYSETREASTIQDVLRDFRGVLVSDFYAGYDSIECPQQKCLIHLIRDMNDDLCKQPYNEEIRTMAQAFSDLVKPMIESVDRFGLKAHHLRKHGRSVNRFYDALFKRDYQTDVAAGYKKRFRKNRNKLFTFLDHDGVPWNNNNAEHAIKAFVRLRRSIGGQSSAKGIRDYLVLLSISETCKYKGVNFLRFLQSGQVDIDYFAGGSSKPAYPSRTFRVEQST